MTDEPTMTEYPDGYRSWWLHGELHRTNGPAVERPDGYRAWYLHGELHRTDGPAIEYSDGSRSWYLHGVPHRVDGPAIERPDGTRSWYLHGELHRTDGPAVERPDGTRVWWRHGVRHRVDGPAFEYPDGTCEWRLDGAPYRADLLALLDEDPAAGILAAADLREQRVVAADAHRALVDAGVVRWRGVVERHESLRSDWPTPVCRWCSEGVDSTGLVDLPIWWPCPDFREVAGEARAYLGGAG